MLVDIGHANASQMPAELVAGAFAVKTRKDTAASTAVTDGAACVLHGQCDSSGALRTTGAGSGGDASASNQTSIITRLGTIATAAAHGSVASLPHSMWEKKRNWKTLAAFLAGLVLGGHRFLAPVGPIV